MEKRYASLNLIGGRVCLDFSNTVSSRRGETGRDYLQDYAGLTSWAEHAGVLDEELEAKLREEAVREPRAAEAVFSRAIRLRESLYGIFSAAARGLGGGAGDLDVLNEELVCSLPHARLVRGEAGGYTWGWEEGLQLDRLIWPLVSSAAELLTSADLSRIGECPGDACGWLYLDVSKNRSRRWCDMRDCGNRSKARRHYAKVRQRE
jgi:predicted RNA-binding Zn ribbon-like protein